MYRTCNGLRCFQGETGVSKGRNSATSMDVPTTGSADELVAASTDMQRARKGSVVLLVAA